jgi:hypothetical protein
MTEIDQKIIFSYSVDKLSEKQISELISVSPNKVRRVLDENNIQRRSRSEASTYYHITKFGQKEFTPKTFLTREEEMLKIAGVMLYWGEGTKKNSSVAFANSDPRMMQVFLRFLRIVCGVSEERLHVTLHYYEDQNPEELTSFWSNIMNLPESQFYKPFLHKKNAKGTYRELSTHGTVSIQYSDKKLLQLIKQWITEYQTLGLATSF